MWIGYLKKLKEFSFLLGVFALPVYQMVNHWFFAAFLGVSIILIFADNSSIKILRQLYLPITAVSAFFLLRLLGFFHAISLEYAFKEALRTLPFLLYPIAIISFKTENFNYKLFEKKGFYALAYGCVLTAIICWSNIIMTLKQNDLPSNTLFGWKKSGTYLTQILDLHPPYLGILIVAAILFLLKEVFYNDKIKIKTKYLNSIASIFLFVFLFNITARNALFFLIMFTFLYLIFTRKWKYLLIPIASVILFGILIAKHPSQFYRIKMYHMLGLSNENIEDKRFDRLRASYEVFKSSPIIGVGPGNDIELKVEQYRIMNDDVATQKRLNSHNQFFEELVAYGILGGLIFIVINAFFFIYFYRNKQYFYLILFCNVLIATLTESMFERVLGIQYYAILISMGILSVEWHKKNNHI